MGLTPLLAVHIADGLLAWPWLAGGFALATALVALAAWRVRDDEVPRIAVLTAAFTVASSIHVRLGPTSVHLLLNGLLGVVLGRRAPLAVLVGLALQAALLGHGGFTTIGVNTCVMALPALLAGMLFGPLHRLPWLRRRWFRSVLVFGSALVWLLSATFAVALLCTNSFSLVVTVSPLPGSRPERLPLPDLGPALSVALHPAVLAAAGVVALALAWWEGRQKNAPEFPLGLFLGVLAVLATLALNALVLVGGGAESWRGWAVVIGLASLPLAVLEGVVLGFTVGFLARVKPELLNGYRPAPREDRPEAAPAAAPLPESSR